MTKNRIQNAGHEWSLALDKIVDKSPAATRRKGACLVDAGVIGAVVL